MTTFIEHSLCGRHRIKCFTCFTLFTPVPAHTDSLSSSDFPESLRSWPKFIQSGIRQSFSKSRALGTTLSCSVSRNCRLPAKEEALSLLKGYLARLSGAEWQIRSRCPAESFTVPRGLVLERRTLRGLTEESGLIKGRVAEGLWVSVSTSIK